MGIDIRDGNQLECINCALCIDACDAVMDKIGKPRGPDLLHHRQPLCRRTWRARTTHWDWRHLLRPRTFIYFGPVGGGRHRHAGVAAVNRDQLDVNVVPDRNPLYRQLSDGSIRNGYTVKILNMKQEPRTFRLTLEDLPGATMEMVGENRRKGPSSIDIAVEPDKLRAVKIYVATSDKDVLEDQRSDFSFEVERAEPQGGVPETGSYETIFHAPGEKDEED